MAPNALEGRANLPMAGILTAQILKPLIGIGFFVAVALLWVIPDPRIERVITKA